MPWLKDKHSNGKHNATQQRFVKMTATENLGEKTTRFYSEESGYALYGRMQ